MANLQVSARGPRRMAALVALTCCYGLLQWVPAPRCAVAQTIDSPDAEDSESSQIVEFPIVIRLSEELFQSPQPEISERVKVDDVVLGRRAVGTATVVGHLAPDFTRSSEDARLELIFAGTSVARTVCQEGPATIHSTTTVQFDLRTPIAFHEQKGFTAEDPEGVVDLVSAVQRVSTSAPGLRGRVARRVAERQLDEQRGAIRAASKESAETRLYANMDRRVEEQLAAWNEHWHKLYASLQEQSWYSDTPSLRVTCDKRHLLVCIGLDIDPQSEPASNDALLDGLPEPRANSLAEILLARETLEEADSVTVPPYLTALAQTLLVLFAQDPALRVRGAHHNEWNVYYIERQSEM